MIYLIHFDKKISHAQHYVGSTRNLKQRIKTHRDSRGANLLRVANERGIRWEVVRIWRLKCREERILKKMKSTANYCPICRKNPHNFQETEDVDLNMVTFNLSNKEENEVQH